MPPLYWKTITVHRGGGAVIVFYCAGRSLPRLAKLPIRLSTPYAHPLLGARLNRHLWPKNRPCGRLASDHRAAARRAVCGSAIFMIQYSTISVNQDALFVQSARPQGRGKSPALRLFTAYATRVPRQNMKIAPHTHIQFWHRESHCGFSA